MYKHYYTAREIKELEAEAKRDERNFYLIDMALVACICIIIGTFIGVRLQQLIGG